VTTPRLLVLQPGHDDPPARLGDWLAGAGAELHLVRPGEDLVPADLSGYDGVVCLGGGMSAWDDEKYPWLVQLRELLAGCVRDKVPLLAVCLGAQLLAKATGGEVEPAPDGPEVGILLVAKRDLGWSDPLFADVPMTPDVVQFHSDAITRLPPGAELLAASPMYQNQAFRLGGHAYAIQFHIETTTDVLLTWARSEPETAALGRPGTFTEEFLDDAHAGIEEVWRPFTERFVALVRGDLEPAVTSARSLPMV
jgi:GMP synthase-like glutamine amidotransferase